MFEQTVQDKTASEAIEDAVEARDFVVKPFIVGLVASRDRNSDEIDDVIKGQLKGWSLYRIPKVSLAILRLAVCEILFEPAIPVSVSINEAIELAKEFGSIEDASYINGVLSTIEKTAKYEKDDEKEEDEESEV